MNKVFIGLLALLISACASTINYNDMEFGRKLSAVPAGGDFEAALSRMGWLCYEIADSDDRPVTAAHIPRVGNEDISVELVTPQLGRRAQACTKVRRQLTAEMLPKPEAFELDLHAKHLIVPFARARLAFDEAD